ncbi:MAG: ribosomal L7Ae/L30e/S12e/Gadd45 family protein [Oscillospiraceae bacterium]|nr:ribosomal L7Ae/L30e/S12e/Gadd45 family protein [Oscillospiraceae bacterium]
MCRGFDAAVKAVRTGKAVLILMCEDLSPKTAKELNYKTAGRVKTVRTNFNMNELSECIGHKTGIITITDQGFADKIYEAYEAISSVRKTDLYKDNTNKN